jgi:hypothetical protein
MPNSSAKRLNKSHTRVQASYLCFTIPIVSPVRVFQHTFIAITTKTFETVATFQPMDNTCLCFNTQHFLMCCKCRKRYCWYQRGIHTLQKQINIFNEANGCLNSRTRTNPSQHEQKATSCSVQFIHTVRRCNCKTEIQMYLASFTTSITIFLPYHQVFYYVTKKLLIIIHVKHNTTTVNLV